MSQDTESMKPKDDGQRRQWQTFITVKAAGASLSLPSLLVSSSFLFIQCRSLWGKEDAESERWPWYIADGEECYSCVALWMSVLLGSVHVLVPCVLTDSGTRCPTKIQWWGQLCLIFIKAPDSNGYSYEFKGILGPMTVITGGRDVTEKRSNLEIFSVWHYSVTACLPNLKHRPRKDEL